MQLVRHLRHGAGAPRCAVDRYGAGRCGFTGSCWRMEWKVGQQRGDPVDSLWTVGTSGHGQHRYPGITSQSTAVGDIVVNMTTAVPSATRQQIIGVSVPLVSVL
ncbi:hypothetical protein ACCO45_010211 [Purpureocillium lilacinum]|uniref:Uncharacterized protein n=1 Tax=Purpureocillium lilacinum TaxID=33203 RepID=A0ACC4DEZ0_PURLI